MTMRPAFWLSMAVLVVAAACDSGSDPSSPTSPSFSASASSTKDGTRNGTKTTTTTVKGAITGLSGSCPALTFTLDGKTIKTSASTTYSGGACAAVKNDVKIAVTGTTQADGSILAAQVRIGTTTTSLQVKVDGTVSGLSGPCPTLAFTLAGKTIKTSAATSYGDRACTDVKNDAKVGVMGTAQADGSVLATQVRLATTSSSSQVTVKGTVAGLSGTCPAVTFTVGGKTIKTSAATSYGDRTCADVKSGEKVGVMGTAEADGSILASQVRIAAPEPVPAFTGAITALAGTCPTLTITVSGKTATTTAATVFTGKACAQLAAGVEVAIYGAVPAGGSVLVATIVRSRK